MATIPGRAEVLEFAKHAVTAKSIVSHDGGIMSSLLSPKKENPLPTADPPCFHGSPDRGYVKEISASMSAVGRKTSGLTPGSSLKHRSPVHGRSPDGRNDFRGLGVGSSPGHVVRHTRQSNTEVFDGMGLEDSGRIRIVGADESEHRKRMNSSLRRLRELLDESLDGAASSGKRLGSPSLLSVSDLRAMASAKRARRNIGDEQVGGMAERGLSKTSR